MNKKKFRIYNIILSDISSTDADFAFGKLIKEKKFEWWRYTPLNWILVTPVSVSTNQIIQYVLESYGATNSYFVLEIEINDVGGMIPGYKERGDTSENLKTPFVFFHSINNPKYIFPWEKSSETEMVK